MEKQLKKKLNWKKRIGLVLLAAYLIKDLRDGGLKVLTVYGSEDGVLNREKLEDGKALLPLITGQSQKRQTVDAIRRLLKDAD